MSIEQTLSIIKPDAVGKNVIGKIMDRFESAGLKIVACRMMHLSREQAEVFYSVHKDKPFYGELVEYMISGAVIVQVLEGEEAILRNRQYRQMLFMGLTGRLQHNRRSVTFLIQLTFAVVIEM